MESIYYVLCWHCHRRCAHCYEDRFRPYRRDELAKVVAEAQCNATLIVANLPDRMTYLDRGAPDPGAASGFKEKVGRIILSGGEVLADPVREPVLYPTLEAIGRKYAQAGGVKIVVQTTGDLLNPRIVDNLLERGVWMISVSGMDDFHVGLEGAKRAPLQQRLAQMFEAAGLSRPGAEKSWTEAAGPIYNFFGATQDAWIGKLWPRGRAWANGLSRATMADNFCNAWSGGLNFLEHRFSGSEVSIDPAGDVYPCCLKTSRALGNLTEEPLTDILDSLAGHPVFEAINAGKPERMGLSHGWSVEDFHAACVTQTPSGAAYRNLCIGCDRFHAEVAGALIAALAVSRRAQRQAEAAHRKALAEAKAVSKALAVDILPFS